MNGLKDVLASIGWNAATGTCANACHGPASWSPAAKLSCTSCHGTPPATGDHARHDTRIACSGCHGAGYSASTTNGVTHLNGTKDVVAAAGWSASSKTCSNSCHGTASWSASATLPCGSCHAIPPATGDHARHDARFACVSCHGSGYSRTTVNPATHDDGTRNVVAAAGWSPSSKTCSNSCHGTASWSASATLPCGSCHAIPPRTGEHGEHASRYGCSTCHGAGYSSTTVNAATHNDGTRNLVATAIGWNPATRSCSNSCHGRESW
jgi:hypothetical protein